MTRFTTFVTSPLVVGFVVLVLSITKYLLETFDDTCRLLIIEPRNDDSFLIAWGDPPLLRLRPSRKLVVTRW